MTSVRVKTIIAFIKLAGSAVLIGFLAALARVVPVG